MMYRSLSNRFGGTRSAYSRKNCTQGKMAEDTKLCNAAREQRPSNMNNQCSVS